MRATTAVTGSAPVGFAQSSGLVAQHRGSTQTTGPAMVLGHAAPTTEHSFPTRSAPWPAPTAGCLLAQQTAANLHAAPGDTVRSAAPAWHRSTVNVDGVVDLPQADSLFQKVGAPPGAQPAAPPDNVADARPGPVAPASSTRCQPRRPDLVRVQIHTTPATTRCPPIPAAPTPQVSAAARNLEARNAGGALVGDNLGAALDAARGDAAYAQVLFVFLGVPGAVLAALLTATVVAAGAQRRRHDQALLRARGASPRQLIRLAAAEATIIGVLGSAAGLAIAAGVGLAAFGSPRLGADLPTAIGWAGASAAAGLLIAVAARAGPGLAGSARRHGQRVARRCAPDPAPKLDPTRSGLRRAGGLGACCSGGQPQRVPARAGPRRGPGDLRVVLGVRRPRPAVDRRRPAGLAARRPAARPRPAGRCARALRPVAGSLSRIIAARAVTPTSPRWPGHRPARAGGRVRRLHRDVQRHLPSQQAEVDAQLTNGADVTVTEPPGAVVGPAAGNPHRRDTWVRRRSNRCSTASPTSAPTCRTSTGSTRPASPASPRCRTTTFTAAPPPSLMHKLAAQPDSVLVCAETVKDFQLVPGDTDQPAPARRPHPPTGHRRIPLHRDRHRVPHRPQGQLLRRQRQLRGPTHRQRRRRVVPRRHRWT